MSSVSIINRTQMKALVKMMNLKQIPYFNKYNQSLGTKTNRFRIV